MAWWFRWSLSVADPFGCASLDLTYNTQFFTAMSVDFADAAFTLFQNAQIDDSSGRVTGISAGTLSHDAGDDGFALLARVYFQPVGSDNVLLQTDGEHVRPVSDLGFGIENAMAFGVGIGEVISESGPILETMLRPVVYDLTDDGIIDFSDFSVFAGVFRDTVEGGSPSEAFAADFNFDNQVDFDDFSLLAAHFRLSRESGGERIYSNDFPTGGNALRARFLPTSISEDSSPSLTDARLRPIAVEARNRIEAASADAVSARIQAELRTVTFEVADLPDDLLAQTHTNVVLIDTDAAGIGWFVDATPATDFEFFSAADSSILIATPFGPAAGGTDLLTVLMHELGHLLGFEHSDQDSDFMYESLPTGVRRLPNLQSAGYEFDTAELNAMFSRLYESPELLPI